MARMTDQPIVNRPEKAMFTQITDVILQQNKAWFPARKIEPTQNFYFMSLDIDGKEIYWRRLRGKEDIIKRLGRYLNDRFGARPGGHAIPVERGHWSRDIQRKRLTGILRRRTSNFENCRGAHRPQLSGQLRLRLDQYALPAPTFELPSLRSDLRVVGSDLDKKTAVVAKKLSDEL